jgi:glycosyltransferase involved in cell wall biosynthesis
MPEVEAVVKPVLGTTAARRVTSTRYSLLARARELNVLQPFRVLGVVPHERVAALLRESVTLNPSLFEGWSTTVEEAKSSGKRVLLSDIPRHREQEARSGQFFDPRDPEALAAALRGLWECSDPGGDRRLIERAREKPPARWRALLATYEGAIARTVADA